MIPAKLAAAMAEWDEHRLGDANSEHRLLIVADIGGFHLRLVKGVSVERSGPGLEYYCDVSLGTASCLDELADKIREAIDHLKKLQQAGNGG